jgi:hypothetical protein
VAVKPVVVKPAVVAKPVVAPIKPVVVKPAVSPKPVGKPVVAVKPVVKPAVAVKPVVKPVAKPVLKPAVAVKPIVKKIAKGKKVVKKGSKAHKNKSSRSHNFKPGNFKVSANHRVHIPRPMKFNIKVKSLGLKLAKSNTKTDKIASVLQKNIEKLGKVHANYLKNLTGFQKLMLIVKQKKAELNKYKHSNQDLYKIVVKGKSALSSQVNKHVDAKIKAHKVLLKKIVKAYRSMATKARSYNMNANNKLANYQAGLLKVKYSHKNDYQKYKRAYKKATSHHKHALLSWKRGIQRFMSTMFSKLKNTCTLKRTVIVKKKVVNKTRRLQAVAVKAPVAPIQPVVKPVAPVVAKAGVAVKPVATPVVKPAVVAKPKLVIKKKVVKHKVVVKKAVKGKSAGKKVVKGKNTKKHTGKKSHGKKHNKKSVKKVKVNVNIKLAKFTPPKDIVSIRKKIFNVMIKICDLQKKKSDLQDESSDKSRVKQYTLLIKKYKSW